MVDEQGGIVVGLGELLWDCFPDGKRAGGAPANVAYHAQLLGSTGVVCSRVGRDPLGRELIQHLADRAVETCFIQFDDHHPTGTVTVDASIPTHPQYVIHQDAAWDFLNCSTQWREFMVRASAVCFGTLAQRSPVSREAIECILKIETDALRVCDVNLRPPWYKPEIIERSLRQAEVVKLNIDEVAVLAGLLGKPEVVPEEFAGLLFEDYDVNIVCITRGPEGCLALSRDERVDIAGREVRVADTVGSGDAFTAALIQGLLHKWPLERTARFANEVGAMVAGREGAMPKLKEEYKRLLLEFG